jgi:hypothetical protein
VNKNLLVAVVIAVALVAGGVFVIWKIQPSMEEQKQIALEGAVRDDSPEFAVLTRKIIAENNVDGTWESPLGTGYVMMNIAGKIKNFTDKTLSGLEIRVSVVDSGGKTVKDKTLIVVPVQQATLAPNAEMDVVVRIDGFRPDDDRARIHWKVTAIKARP